MPDETLRARIERLASLPDESMDEDEARDAVRDLLGALNAGTVRAAMPQPERGWTVNTWVKRGILLGFRIGRLVDASSDGFAFFDKDTYPLKPLSLTQGVRLVPGGSAVRTGAYVAPGVVCMPPMYINVGAYVDAGTLVDSHALIGSCAQIGQRVHVSAAAQIGGVLEPAGALPVIVEDDVFVGGGCGIYEGCIVGRGAVLAPGVQLTGSTRLYDLVKERIYVRSAKAPLTVPEGAVVVPGSRGARGAFAGEHGIALYVPVIVKYRDASTDSATALEDALR